MERILSSTDLETTITKMMFHSLTHSLVVQTARSTAVPVPACPRARPRHLTLTPARPRPRAEFVALSRQRRQRRRRRQHQHQHNQASSRGHSLAAIHAPTHRSSARLAYSWLVTSAVYHENMRIYIRAIAIIIIIIIIICPVEPSTCQPRQGFQIANHTFVALGCLASPCVCSFAAI